MAGKQEIEELAKAKLHVLGKIHVSNSGEGIKNLAEAYAILDSVKLVDDAEADDYRVYEGFPTEQ